MSSALSSTHPIPRPQTGEHIPYFGRYIEKVTGDDARVALARQIDDTLALLRPLDETRALHRYEPGKWSVKEVVGHVMDGERVFAYRALRFARKDETPLPGFDENTWVPAGNFDRRPLADLLDEFAAVRAATLRLFGGFEESALTRMGRANDAPVSVRALAWIIAGHEVHHRGLLIERYGIR
jgi:hypothetical protein